MKHFSFIERNQPSKSTVLLKHLRIRYIYPKRYDDESQTRKVWKRYYVRQVKKKRPKKGPNSSVAEINLCDTTKQSNTIMVHLMQFPLTDNLHITKLLSTWNRFQTHFWSSPVWTGRNYDYLSSRRSHNYIRNSKLDYIIENDWNWVIPAECMRLWTDDANIKIFVCHAAARNSIKPDMSKDISVEHDLRKIVC